MKSEIVFLLNRISQTIERYAMLQSGQRVGVAVSGGADSVCLLYALRELAPRWKLSLHVLHLDHGLRGAESRNDAEFVRRLAAHLALPVTIRAVDLSSHAGNLEQAGRQTRVAFFRELIQSGEVDRVALGHTRNDQAETVLFRFLRGAGTAGLAGIRPVTSDGIIRPLLETDRSEVEAFLRTCGVAWREDSTNGSLDFARNRIRHHLLPQLAEEWNPAITEALSRTADWALEEEAYWQTEIDALAARTLVEREGAVLVRAADLTALPVAAPAAWSAAPWSASKATCAASILTTSPKCWNWRLPRRVMAASSRPVSTSAAPLNGCASAFLPPAARLPGSRCRPRCGAGAGHKCCNFPRSD